MSTAVGNEMPLLDLAEGAEAALEVLEDFLAAEVSDALPLVATGLDKRFGGVHAVNNVSLTVPPHMLVGLIGPNGAGKSTLFNLLNGFEFPDTGTVEFFGKDVTKLPPWTRARLGMTRTFQANHVDPDETVLDNLMTGAHLSIQGGLLGATFRTRRNWLSEERATKATEAVARLLGLEAVLKVPAGSLDFGAQRRTELGRSIMGRPRLLLLDEPAAGLDSFEALEVMALVKRVQSDLRLAVLLIEHFVEAVFEYCDTVNVIVQGQLVAAGTPEQVAADPKVRSAYLGEEE
jgi:branched-chain amino acid transport system ATP-binding protein